MIVTFLSCITFSRWVIRIVKSQTTANHLLHMHRVRVCCQDREEAEATQGGEAWKNHVSMWSMRPCCQIKKSTQGAHRQQTFRKMPLDAYLLLRSH